LSAEFYRQSLYLSLYVDLNLSSSSIYFAQLQREKQYMEQTLYGQQYCCAEHVIYQWSAASFVIRANLLILIYLLCGNDQKWIR